MTETTDAPSINVPVVENGALSHSERPVDTPSSDAPAPRRFQLSDESEPLVIEAQKLLSLKPTSVPTIDYSSKDTSDHGYVPALSRSSSTSVGVRPSNPYKLHTSPSFNRVNFDDVVLDSVADRKPAWSQLQESIKDSYYKPKHTAERQEEVRDFQESLLNRRSYRNRSVSPFANLPRYTPTRNTSYTSSYSRAEPYAAPAVSSSQGIEDNSLESRYDRLINDMESRLLKTTYGLGGPRARAYTTTEFRRAPSPATGSATEAYLDETDPVYMPRPYYSRPNRSDPDYFDFDLQHSVDMYRKPEGRYIPRGPTYWENKILGDYKSKGEAPISGHMFTKGDDDYRTTSSSLLSAALRTPSFWEHRFTSIGNQVRESNPVSFASLERNRPVPNRFTEYRDPDLESSDGDLSD